MAARRRAALQALKPAGTGLETVDALSVDPVPTLSGYVQAASEYIRSARMLSPGAAKRAQIALSGGLGRVLASELKARLPDIQVVAGERTVAGALRSARADVSESHELDGLRLAVELKPINLAVGRAIWNRFGDVRAFAVNIHLKFPFAVVGGVLAIPTSEWKIGSSSASDVQEVVDSDDEEAVDELRVAARAGRALQLVPTTHLIARAIRRFERTRARETEADATHLLEAVAIVVYDPETGVLSDSLPALSSKLRWEHFVAALAEAYELRFES
ncbi:MAG: hypothetical protein WC211_11760 [Dehalococcoidia bacterium]